MTALSAFLPLVLPYAPGVSDLAVYQALRDSAIDFCRRTGLVQTVVAFNVVADTQDYAVTIPTDMQLAFVMGVAVEGRWLQPVSPDQIESDTALRGADIGDADLVTGTPMYYFQKSPSSTSISLYPVPDTAVTSGLTIKTAFMPTRDAATLDDLLYNDYAEGIAAGALARIVAQPGQMFSANSAPYAAAYERAVNNAKRLKERGKLPSNLSVRPRSFV